MSLAARVSTGDLVRAPEFLHRATPLDEWEWDTAAAMLSDGERRRMRRSTAHGAEVLLTGRLLARSLAGDILGLDPAEVPLSAACPDCGEEHGRPIIEGTRLHVSLSHCDGVTVAAASWGAAVGVDIERNDHSPQRLDAIETLTGQRSLRHWTRVEAVLKADGRGLRVDPGKVRVLVDGARLEAWVDGSAALYRLIDLELGSEDGSGVIGSAAVELAAA